MRQRLKITAFFIAFFITPLAFAATNLHDTCYDFNYQCTGNTFGNTTNAPWSVLVYHGQYIDTDLLGVWQTSNFRGNSSITSVELARELTPNNFIRRFFQPFISTITFNANTSYKQDPVGPIYEFDPFFMFHWQHFPWDKYILNTFGLGWGVSYDSQISHWEQVYATNGTERFLNYLAFEATFALPSSPQWQLVFRVHHRSNAYGLYGPGVTGSNYFGLGIRYIFGLDTPADKDFSYTSTHYLDYKDLPQLHLAVMHSGATGFISGFRVGNYLFNQDNALQFGFDFAGSNEFRLTGTWAFLLDADNRFKVTAEQFSQGFHLAYATNNDLERIGQKAIGGMYEHLLHNNNWIKNLFVSSYYMTANSASQGSAAFTNSQGSFIDEKRYSGGTGGGATTGITLQPWQRTRAELDLNYDALGYNTCFVAADNKAGIGASVTLQQLLSDYWKISATASDRAIFKQLGASIDWLMKTRPGTRFEWGLTASRLSGEPINSSDNRLMLTAAYSWGGDPSGDRASYTNDDPDSLINWSFDPVVAMPAVFVQQDEGIIKAP